MTQEFLACYDYGQGGIWGVILADDRGQIERRFPQLTVFDYQPDWMDDDEYKRIKSLVCFPIDQPSPVSWFPPINQ